MILKIYFELNIVLFKNVLLQLRTDERETKIYATPDR